MFQNKIAYATCLMLLTTPVLSETRCGWLTKYGEGPIGDFMSLTDNVDTWQISYMTTKGQIVADGMHNVPKIDTHSGHICSCLKVKTHDGFIDLVSKGWQKPHSACENDANLKARVVL